MSLRFIYSDGSSETKDIGLTANTARMVEVLSRNGEGKKIEAVEIRFENRTSTNGPLVGVRNVSIKGMRVR